MAKLPNGQIAKLGEEEGGWWVGSLTCDWLRDGCFEWMKNGDRVAREEWLGGVATYGTGVGVVRGA